MSERCRECVCLGCDRTMVALDEGVARDMSEIYRLAGEWPATGLKIMEAGRRLSAIAAIAATYEIAREHQPPSK